MYSMLFGGAVGAGSSHGMRTSEWPEEFRWNVDGRPADNTSTAKDDQEMSTTTTTTTITRTSVSAAYIRMLSNDNLVIVDTPRTPDQNTSSASVQRNDRSLDLAVSSNRAGATLRGLSDDELPQPDTVRRAKDVFEALSRKKSEQAWTLPRKKSVNSSGINRSQSMIVLTGRAWCNGSHRHNGVCSSAVTGSRGVVQLGRSNTLPPVPRYKRSCSDLDKFFRKRGSDDDESLLDERNETGSPVSPEVIRNIRGHGTCVTFFGGRSFVEYVESSSDVDDDDDDTSDSGVGGERGYVREYPYDLYRGPGSRSPPWNGRYGTASLDRRIPKIVSFLPKMAATSTSASNPPPSSSSTTSSLSGSGENPPGPPSWMFSMEELKSTFVSRGEDVATDVNSSRSDSSNGGCVSDWMTPNRCHGRWQKNPYWSGSYYVIYDFTIVQEVDDVEETIREAD